jgi:quercetin dioxygenase-like cupin family protein
MTDQTVIRKPGEGNAYWVMGGLYKVLAASDETGGTTVMEMNLRPGMGPPPHTHPGAETVYVVEGTIKYHIGDDSTEGGPGSFFHVPAGTTENFEPLTDAKVIATYEPGGIDKFFAEIGEPAPRHEMPPMSDEPPDIEHIAAVAAKYGMVIQTPTSV